MAHRRSAPQPGWVAPGLATLAGLVLMAGVLSTATASTLHRDPPVQAAVVPAPTRSPTPALAPAPAPPPAPASPPAVARAHPPAGPVVVLGDSVAAGSNCGCTPYATLLGRALAQRTGKPVSVVNAGARGLTSARLLDQLEDSDLQRALRTAGVVTVTIGANDFDESLAAESACRVPDACYADALTTMSTNLQAALGTIERLAPSGAEVLVTGYWNVFLDGTVGRAQGAEYVANSDALTRRVNSLIQCAARAAQATFVDEYAPFESGSLASLTALLAPDGDHPSATGHALIARLLLAAL